MDTQALENIVKAFDNQNWLHFAAQIKDYGIMQFHLDLMGYLRTYESDCEDSNAKAYGYIVHEFHLMFDNNDLHI